MKTFVVCILFFCQGPLEAKPSAPTKKPTLADSNIFPTHQNHPLLNKPSNPFANGQFDSVAVDKTRTTPHTPPPSTTKPPIPPNDPLCFSSYTKNEIHSQGNRNPQNLKESTSNAINVRQKTAQGNGSPQKGAQNNTANSQASKVGHTADQKPIAAASTKSLPPKQAQNSTKKPANSTPVPPKPSPAPQAPKIVASSKTSSPKNHHPSKKAQTTHTGGANIKRSVDPKAAAQKAVHTGVSNEKHLKSSQKSSPKSEQASPSGNKTLVGNKSQSQKSSQPGNSPNIANSKNATMTTPQNNLSSGKNSENHEISMPKPTQTNSVKSQNFTSPKPTPKTAPVTSSDTKIIQSGKSDANHLKTSTVKTNPASKVETVHSSGSQTSDALKTAAQKKIEPNKVASQNSVDSTGVKTNQQPHQASSTVGSSHIPAALKNSPQKTESNVGQGKINAGNHPTQSAISKTAAPKNGQTKSGSTQNPKTGALKAPQPKPNPVKRSSNDKVVFGQNRKEIPNYTGPKNIVPRSVAPGSPQTHINTKATGSVPTQPKPVKRVKKSDLSRKGSYKSARHNKRAAVGRQVGKPHGLDQLRIVSPSSMSGGRVKKSIVATPEELLYALNHPYDELMYWPPATRSRRSVYGAEPEVNIREPEVNIREPEVNIWETEINAREPEVNVRHRDWRNTIDFSAPLRHKHRKPDTEVVRVKRSVNSAPENLLYSLKNSVIDASSLSTFHRSPRYDLDEEEPEAAIQHRKHRAIPETKSKLQRMKTNAIPEDLFYSLRKPLIDSPAARLSLNSDRKRRGMLAEGPEERLESPAKFFRDLHRNAPLRPSPDELNENFWVRKI